MSDLILQVGDTGTKVLVTIVEDDDDGNPQPVDCSEATTKEIKLRRVPALDEDTPDAIVRAASFETDGTDGQLFIVTEADDLDQEGSWLVQGRVVIGAGEWHSRKGRFRVEDNL